MELIKGKDFAATCVRFQIIAQNDILDKPDYMVKFYQETESTWTVIYTPTTGGWPISLCILMTYDPIDENDTLLKDILENQFPKNYYIKKICIFQINKDFKVVDKKWVEKISSE